MNGIFRSKPAVAAALVLCYISSYMAICSVNWAFAYYTSRIFGFNAKVDFLYIGGIICAGMFLFLGISIWKADTGKSGFLHLLEKIDYPLLVVISVVVIRISYYILSLSETFFFITAPIAAYFIGIVLFASTLIHIRDKTFRKTFYWLDFFASYKASSLIGITTFALLAGNTFIIIFYSLCSNDNFNIFIFLYAGFTLTALTYFQNFIMSMSTLYQKANEDKIKSERFKTELITNVSHDIKTPLTSIINCVDLIKRLNIKNQALEGYIETLDKKSQRLKLLINDLMDASKASTGYVTVEPQLINLPELIMQIAGEYDQMFIEKKLNFIFKQSSDETVIISDGRHLWRVMDNIFGNAAKYSMYGTRVYAEIKNDGKIISFHLKNISNEPIDMASDELTGQFVRGDRSRSTEGSGLGLYIAKSLAELMHCDFKIIINGDLFEVIISWGETGNVL